MSNPPDQTDISRLHVAQSLACPQSSYAQSLHEDGLVYGFYGFFDGLNLALTMPKLWFDACYNNSLLAARAFHDWMSTPIGMAIMIAEGLTVVSLSLFGSILDDNDPNPIKSSIATYWPYLREFKMLKWTYKGIRNVFLALLLFSGDDLRSLIFPTAIVLGLLSVVNRWWQRSMRNERKDMMKKNAIRYQQISLKGDKLHILEKPPDPQNETFHGCLAWVLSDLSEDNATQQPELLYINQDGISEKIQIQNIKEFEFDLENILTENLLHFLSRKLELHYPSALQTKAPLLIQFVTSKDIETIDSTHDCPQIVYITDTEQTRLRYIDEYGNWGEFPKDIQWKFEADLADARTNINLVGPTETQLKTLLTTHAISVPEPLGMTLEDWDRYRKDQETQLAETGRQSHQLKTLCYLSVLYGSILESFYFYIGPLTLALFAPSLFLVMLSISTTFALLYICGKIYEEYDFQRKLIATELNAQLALSIKEFDLILNESNRLLASTDLSDTTTLDELTQRCGELINDIDEQRQALLAAVNHSVFTLTFEGIKNGLGIQGVISSAMFASATIMMICSLPCPPMFVLGCAIASLAAICSSMIQILISFSYSPQPVSAPRLSDSEKIRSILEALEQLKQNHTDPQFSPNYVIDARIELYDRVVQYPLFPVFEYCDAVRYLFAGADKGNKLLTYFTGQQLSELHDSPILFIIAAITSLCCAIIVGISFLLRSLAKSFGRPDVASVENNSFLQVPLIRLSETTDDAPQDDPSPTQYGAAKWDSAVFDGEHHACQP